MDRKIGGYFGLDLRGETLDPIYSLWKTWTDGRNILDFNSNRVAIKKILQIEKIHRIWLPYYICNDVKEALSEYEVNYYQISNEFIPQDYFLDDIESDDCVVLVSYFGLPISDIFVKKIRDLNKKILIIEDKAQSIEPPNINVDWSIYSPRKFMGVPDGGVAVTKRAFSHPQVKVKECADIITNFLPILMRNQDETMSSGQYETYIKSEKSIFSHESRASKITIELLKISSYLYISKKRINNWNYLNSFLQEKSIFSCLKKIDWTPLGYPIIVENPSDFVDYMAKHGVFCARHWSCLGDELNHFEFENDLSKKIVTIPIDQRLNKPELNYLISKIRDYDEKK